MPSKLFYAAALTCLVLSLSASDDRPAAQEQPPAPSASLVIEVVGFADASGNATICLFDSEEAYKSADVRKERKDVQRYMKALKDVQIDRAGNDFTASCRIDDLQPGEYAAFTFHDRNQNGKVDFSVFGFPTEPFGLSNDVRPQMLPVPRVPSWKAAAFRIRPGANLMRIRVKS